MMERWYGLIYFCTLLAFVAAYNLCKTPNRSDFYAEAISHHAGMYVNNGQTPDVVFRWNDEK